jgi:hypothetical protein
MSASKGGAPEACMALTTIIDTLMEVGRHFYGLCIKPA